MKKILPLLVCFCFSHASHAQEPEDLNKLRERYIEAANKAVHPIALKYIQQLDLLASNYRRQEKMQDLAFVEKELMGIRSLNEDGFVQRSSDGDSVGTIIAEREGNHQKRLQGIWSRTGGGNSMETFEFKETDVMIRKSRYATQGGGTSEQMTQYTIELNDQKLVITPQGTQHPEYRNWFEISIPFSEETLVMTDFATRPGSSTKSTVSLERKPLIPSASFWQTDVIQAICDTIEPRTSNDLSIPRQTWFPNRGTNEWVQLDFQKAKTVSKSKVYWFDDVATGGGCQVPKSARLLYKSGDEWIPVNSKKSLGNRKDNWNRVDFEAVETTALRLEVQLEKGFSGGVLEWSLD